MKKKTCLTQSREGNPIYSWNMKRKEKKDFPAGGHISSLTRTRAADVLLKSYGDNVNLI